MLFFCSLCKRSRSRQCPVCPFSRTDRLQSRGFGPLLTMCNTPQLRTLATYVFPPPGRWKTYGKPRNVPRKGEAGSHTSPVVNQDPLQYFQRNAPQRIFSLTPTTRIQVYQVTGASSSPSETRPQYKSPATT